MTEIDPDAENSHPPSESSKGFGEHVKDAAHDLKEDAKGVVRRDKSDEEDEGAGDEDAASDGEDETA